MSLERHCFLSIPHHAFTHSLQHPPYSRRSLTQLRTKAPHQLYIEHVTTVKHMLRKLQHQSGNVRSNQVVLYLTLLMQLCIVELVHGTYVHVLDAVSWMREVVVWSVHRHCGVV